MQKYYGYIVWFVVTLFVVYSFCLNTASAVFAESIKASLYTSNLGVSIASGAFILGFACMQIPAGYLLDKWNARLVVSSGVCLLAIGNIIISLAGTLTVYALANFLQGIGASFAFVAAAVLIARWFAAEKFPILFGFTQTLSCICAAIIHYYFTLALISYSWNDLYYGLAGFGFILLLLTLLLLKSPSGYKQEATLSLKQSLAVVLNNRQILLSAIAAATSFGVLLAYAGLWYLRVQSYYAVDNLQAVIIGGMIFWGTGIGTPLWGYLSNKIKSRVMIIHVTLCVGTMLLLLGLYLPHFNINTLVISKIISFFIGFFLSGSMLFFTIVSEISTALTRGVAVSVLNTAVFLFNTLLLFIPFLFLTVFSTDFFTYLWVLPFFLLLAILLVYFVKDSIASR
ncbi:major facilitator family transporter [Legionella donaldsonii]|uniref:Major facilitator family transporter n=1 Tax=Legionella donaldsonii TaxID=45060 RepID=A0A378IYS5_9GAMM|nr:MFS transporter [Legionella donaldsonii]STX40525.1 major facilitator family transporter [Legionella donaldsonii]